MAKGLGARCCGKLTLRAGANEEVEIENASRGSWRCLTSIEIGKRESRADLTAVHTAPVLSSKSSIHTETSRMDEVNVEKYRANSYTFYDPRLDDWDCRWCRCLPSSWVAVPQASAHVARARLWARCSGCILVEPSTSIWMKLVVDKGCRLCQYEQLEKTR